MICNKSNYDAIPGLSRLILIPAIDLHMSCELQVKFNIEYSKPSKVGGRVTSNVQVEMKAEIWID